MAISKKYIEKFEERIKLYLENLLQSDFLDKFSLKEAQNFIIKHLKLIPDEILQNASKFVSNLLAKQIDKEIIQKFSINNLNDLLVCTVQQLSVDIILNIMNMLNSMPY